MNKDNKGLSLIAGVAVACIILVVLLFATIINLGLSYKDASKAQQSSNCTR